MISPLAFVHSNAKLGENVTVEPFAMIHGDVVIGDGCHISSNSVIMDGTRMGKNCKIFPGAVIGAVPQDLKFVGEYTTVEIGDNNVIRECATINRGTKAKNKTVIGSNNLIMAYAHIGHDCIVGDGCVIVNCVQMAGEVEVGDFVIIGGSSGITQFTRIASHTYFAGGSQIRKDVPPFVRAAREPLCFVGINAVGLRRRGYTNEAIGNIQEIYRIIYQSNLNHTQAVEKIEATMPKTPERDMILDFIKGCKRGLMKGFTSMKEGEE